MALTHAHDTFLTRLHPTLQARIRTDTPALTAASADASHVPSTLPAALLLPRSAEEVSLIAKEAALCGVGLVPRGAGTGKAGGCVPGKEHVVVDLSGMNRLLQLKPADLYAVVEPGFITADLDRAAHEHGLMYPPDPASWESCTLGGNIATNAGGPRAVKYGVTRRYVWGLQVVLAGGDVLNLGRHSIKGVAGLDLTNLFVGSEGILGFITEATLHLVPAPQGLATAWLGFADVQAASLAAARVFEGGVLPCMLELLDAQAMQAVRPLCTWPMPTCGAGLLVETDAFTHEQAAAELERLCELAAAQAGFQQSMVASSTTQREAMLRSRRLVSSSLKTAYPYKMSDDIAVPRSRMPELLQTAYEMADKAGLLASAYGHLGDGNLHINLLCKTPEQRLLAQPVRQALWQAAVHMQGTVSGEHGIGLSKLVGLQMEQSTELINWQRRLKHCLDPQGIINPGKVFV